MIFTLNPKADVNATSLATDLHDISIEQMEARFGPPHGDAYRDDAKGYSGDEWYFTDENGKTYTLYARWGILRIGTVDPGDWRSEVEAFAAFLRREVA